MVPFTSQVFFCRQPINGLADLKGKKVRVFGRSLADLVTAVGATSVTIPFGEVVPRCRPASSIARSPERPGQHREVAGRDVHISTPCRSGWSISFYAVNATRWNQLDPGVRQLVETEIKAFEDRHLGVHRQGGPGRTRCNAGKDPCEFGVKGRDDGGAGGAGAMQPS